MKTFLTFIACFIIFIIGTVFNGWVYLMTYDYGIMHVINYFCNAPEIPFNVFIVFGCAISILKVKTSIESNDVIDSAKKFGSNIITKACLICILVILNMIFI